MATPTEPERLVTLDDIEARLQVLEAEAALLGQYAATTCELLKRVGQPVDRPTAE